MPKHPQNFVRPLGHAALMWRINNNEALWSYDFGHEHQAYREWGCQAARQRKRITALAFGTQNMPSSTFAAWHSIWVSRPKQLWKSALRRSSSPVLQVHIVHSQKKNSTVYNMRQQDFLSELCSGPKGPCSCDDGPLQKLSQDYPPWWY